MKPHPWNTDFAWQPGRAVSGVLTPDQVDHYDTHGWVVLETVLDLDQLKVLTAKLDQMADETSAGLRQLEDERFMIAEADAIVFGVHPVKRFGEAREFATQPVFEGLCRDLIGPEPRLFWDQLVYKYPQKPRRFPWHQDNGYGFVEPQQYLTCWVPLNEATVENGCPWVAPGLHHQGTLHHEYVDPLGFECFADHPDAAPAPVQPGDVLVFSSLTPHLTGPNLTDDVRKAYILQYSPDGAQILRGEPGDGPPTHREPTDTDRHLKLGWGNGPG